MSIAFGLLIADGLKGLSDAEAIAIEAFKPREAIVHSKEQLLNRLMEWDQAFVKDNSRATVMAVRSDWQQYLAWCEGTKSHALPCSVNNLEAFLENAIARGRKRATLSRYVYTIGLIHDAVHLPNPVKEPSWKQKWKALVVNIADAGSDRMKQARALTAADIDTIRASLGDSPIDLRDAALLSVAYDTLCRESELVRIEVADIKPDKGTGKYSLIVWFSKVDQAGTGTDKRYISAETYSRIQVWLKSQGITEGRIFRPIRGRPKKILVDRLNQTAAAESRKELSVREKALITSINPQEVARIFRRRAAAAGIEGSKEVSGHSARVGSANDLIKNGASTAQTMRAGGWKSEAMVMHYARNSRAGQNAMEDMRAKRK